MIHPHDACVVWMEPGMGQEEEPAVDPGLESTHPQPQSCVELQGIQEV